MGKEYKPKYKLTIKYPRLPLKFESGDIVYYNALSKAYVRERFPHYAVDVNEVENNPYFWEEVEQPLFVTDDNIEIFDDATEIISVSIKHHTVSKWGYRYLSKPLDCENFKHFGIEANADKYIEENKPEPLFITEDGVDKFYSNQTLWNLKKLMPRIAWVASKDSKYYAIANQCFAEASSNKDKLFKQEPNADEHIEENKPEPLFTTEDGVEVFDKNQALWEVLPDFQRVVTVAEYVEKGNKTFNYESNADKYIEDHKPKTLFITEDGVNIDHPKENVFLVNEFFEKDEGWYNESVGGKVFFHESNADEYIWRNKRVFSYEDMKKANIDINWCTEDIYHKAKERSEE